MRRNCPKCDADISDTYEPDDWSCGIVGGWFCDPCNLGVGEDDVDREPMDGDVGIAPIERPEPIGTPLSQISGRPGHPGFEQFRAIAKSWGYD